MTELVVYGASDDLVELEGTIREEFQCNDGTGFVAISDGTLLSVTYDDNGVWRLNRLAAGKLQYSKDEAQDEEGQREDGRPAYSDIVHLHGPEPVSWAVFGDQRIKP